MTDKEKILRDMKTLRESIRLDWVEMANKQWDDNDRSLIRANIELCIVELQELMRKLPLSN